MEFDWDSANIDHVARHRVSVVEAEEALRNDPVDLAFENDAGEDRMTQIGATRSGRVLVLVWTWRKSRIRVVTAFDATRTMRIRYGMERGVGNG